MVKINYIIKPQFEAALCFFLEAQIKTHIWQLCFYQLRIFLQVRLTTYVTLLIKGIVNPK